MHRLGFSLTVGATTLFAGCTVVPPEIAGQSPTVLYTFTSGLKLEGGDDFDWPSEGSGLLINVFPAAIFETPDAISFQNDIGNNLFFDDNYLLPDDAVAGNGITGEAMWGNPRPIKLDRNGDRVAETIVIRINPPVARVAFDFAWVLAQEPDRVSLVVASAAPGPDTPAGSFDAPLTQTFPAGAVFQNATGYSGRIAFDIESLQADHDIALSGGIGFITVFVDPVSDLAGTKAFAIDNFTTNDADGPN